MNLTHQDTGNTSFYQAFRIQMRVIGALLMRELHTRYGRHNIGYLWIIAEPLMLGCVIALLHSGQTAHEGTINPVAMTVIGYATFITFRGIVNRADGSLRANLPLLYHRMVTVLDIAVARAVLEQAGTFSAFVILLGGVILLGYAGPPVRPLYLLLGLVYVFVFSLGISLIIAGGAHERPLLERFIHPFSYFMIPLSGAFYQLEWIPQPYRGYLQWIPLPHMFEIIRYGQFPSATLEFVDFQYVTLASMATLLFGLICTNAVHDRIHLS